MAKIITIKQYDTWPVISQNTDLDLFGAVVTFLMRRRGPSGELTVFEDAEVGDGKVFYTWQDGDTDIPGFYYGEFKIELPDGQITTPSDTYLQIKIVPVLGVSGS